MTNNKPKTYTYLDGIKECAHDMKGDESIHIGIRPYELHAGNKLAIVAYPILLCEELEKLGKTPKIRIILSLNDWEQRVLAGSDIYKYHFDIKPLDTTIQYATEKDGITSTPRHWGGKIVEAMSEITNRYPEVTVEPYFNSDLKDKPAMKEVILKTIFNPAEIKEIMLRTTGHPTDDSSTRFASVVCPHCHDANTETIRIDGGETLSSRCTKCNTISEGQYEDFMYWLHHKPLFSARWKALGFTHSLSGGDHFAEGDVEVRRKLYSYFFNAEPPRLDMIFSSTLLGTNGKKMSKSRANFFDADIETILNAARASKTVHEINIKR